jgi:hypothetical protein
LVVQAQPIRTTNAAMTLPVLMFVLTSSGITCPPSPLW